MKPLATCIAAVALLAVSRAQPAAVPAATAPAAAPAAPAPNAAPALTAPALTRKLPPAAAHGGWEFSLIPKAFQSDPSLDMTFITEMTDFGKKQPPVSPESPAYYVAQSSGFRTTGDARPAAPLAEADVEKILRHSLATDGYLPATAAHPPTIAVFYFWGAHMLIDNPAVTDEQWTQNILQRAALAGGEKFAAELNKAIQQSDSYSAANSSRLGSTPATTAGTSDGSTGGDSLGNLGAAAAVNELNGLMDPIRLFTQRSAKNQFLVDQASSDCYYLVASAFDYSSLATHEKKLLWRTRMTVNATGVSQLQSLPTLIATAAPYFGLDMSEAETLTKRAVPLGKVDVGTPVVVDPPPAKKP